MRRYQNDVKKTENKINKLQINEKFKTISEVCKYFINFYFDFRTLN